MSTVEPSVSLRPLVTRGYAITPPVPVVVAVPAPCFMNHVSTVNADNPSAVVLPNVT